LAISDEAILMVVKVKVKYSSVIVDLQSGETPYANQ
jgi:hypothetical protein